MIPENGSIYLRISDNVLDEVDWPIVRLNLVYNKVVLAKLIHAGAHSAGGFPGLGANAFVIERWLKKEPAGFPETYHNVYDARCFICSSHVVKYIGVVESMTKTKRVYCACEKHKHLLDSGVKPI